MILSGVVGNNVISASSRIWLLIQVTASCDFLLEIYSSIRGIPTVDSEKVLFTLTVSWDHLRSKMSIVQRRTSAMRNILVWLGRSQCLTCDKTRKATSTDTPANAERKRRSFVGITLRPKSNIDAPLVNVFQIERFFSDLSQKKTVLTQNKWTDGRKDDQISEADE